MGRSKIPPGKRDMWSIFIAANFHRGSQLALAGVDLTGAIGQDVILQESARIHCAKINYF